MTSETITCGSARFALVMIAGLFFCIETAHAIFLPRLFGERSEASVGGPPNTAAQGIDNNCVFTPIPFFISCGTVPTAATVTAFFDTAEASTNGVGGSQLSILAFAPPGGDRRIEAKVLEKGIFVDRLRLPGEFAKTEVRLRAFFPEINMRGLFAASSALSYDINIGFVPDPSVSPAPTTVFSTSGVLSNGVFTTSGADIGAEFDPVDGSVTVRDFFLDIVLGTVSSPSRSFEVELNKTVLFEQSADVQFLEFAFASIEDPFGLLRNGVTVTEVGPAVPVSEPGFLALLAIALAGLCGSRRKLQRERPRSSAARERAIRR